MGLLIPRPNSKSSSVRPSSTYRTDIQFLIKPQTTSKRTHLLNSSHRQTNSIRTACAKGVPCHSWRFQSRLPCTWTFPWQPPARPGLHPPSTATCMCFEWAPPAGGGPAAPLHQTGSAVWGCQSLDWSGEVMVWHTGGGSGSEGIWKSKKKWLIWRQINLKIRWR